MPVQYGFPSFQPGRRPASAAPRVGQVLGLGSRVAPRAPRPAEGRRAERDGARSPPVDPGEREAARGRCGARTRSPLDAERVAALSTGTSRAVTLTRASAAPRESEGGEQCSGWREGPRARHDHGESFDQTRHRPAGQGRKSPADTILTARPWLSCVHSQPSSPSRRAASLRAMRPRADGRQPSARSLGRVRERRESDHRGLRHERDRPRERGGLRRRRRPARTRPAGSTRRCARSSRPSSTRTSPVVFYVYPEGSRAASAGVFLAMAADVAAMAPQTNIGSSTPISATGEEIPEDLRRKVVNDAAAFVGELAREHGRNERVGARRRHEGVERRRERGARGGHRRRRRARPADAPRRDRRDDDRSRRASS